MCRHLAYLGPSVALGELLVSPRHSLVRQSWAPRRQEYGTVNADGFGVGWYAEQEWGGVRLDHLLAEVAGTMLGADPVELVDEAPGARRGLLAGRRSRRRS